MFANRETTVVLPSFEIEFISLLSVAKRGFLKKRASRPLSYNGILLILLEGEYATSDNRIRKPCLDAASNTCTSCQRWKKVKMNNLHLPYLIDMGGKI